VSGTTEAFARAKIGELLKGVGWNLTEGTIVLFEDTLPDGTKAGYVPCDCRERPMVALEVKRASIDPIAAQDRGRRYAERLDVQLVFLSNGEEVRFLDRETDAFVREIDGFYARQGIARPFAAGGMRRSEPLSALTIRQDVCVPSFRHP